MSNVITPIGPITGPGSTSGVLYFVLSARDLPLRDRVVGSTVQDPYIKWSVKDNVNHTLVEAHKTKFRQGEPNPNWHDEVFSFDWRKGTGQIWRFEVMDKDAPLNKDDAIGYLDVDVDAYVTNKNQQFSGKLSGTSQGSIFVSKTSPISFKISAQNLPKLDAFKGLSDPYVKVFWSVGADGPKTQIHQTKTVKNVENAEWADEILFASYQFGTNQYLTFEVYDDDKIPRDDSLGTVTLEVDSFVRSKKATALKLLSDGFLTVTPVNVQI